MQFVQRTKDRWTSGLHEALRKRQFENIMVVFEVAYYKTYADGLTVKSFELSIILYTMP